ncbi:putative 50 kda protein in type i retrotransposable element r1dm [Lasius niger]|uniref:Putative 50 kDa protein in type i retrotransposable element r1dm n=1 Tax=Lasius niger TaxID=67767 RepID=A0A0J7JWD1_LASNI|nr:putative 50 kda protein in type i retrotransposable element r1dm [Lasius niger]
MGTAQIKIGWALARVELLEPRPLQCYKCLEGGHVRARCPNNVNRSGRCYRCGQEGHTAVQCAAVVKCPVCSDKGLPANHRTGSESYTPVHKGKRGVPLNRVVVAGPSTSTAAAPAPKKKGAAVANKKEESAPKETPLSTEAPSQGEP